MNIRRGQEGVLEAKVIWLVPVFKDVAAAQPRSYKN